MKSEKRFTDVNVDFEESWIKLKDNGDFLIFPISFNDKEEYGLETLEDLLNGLSDKIDEQQATISYLEEANPRLQEQLGETLALVDEQQTTITHLEKVNGKNFAKRRLLEQDNLVLRNENEQLRKELKELENNYKDLLYDGGFDE